MIAMRFFVDHRAARAAAGGLGNYDTCSTNADFLQCEANHAQWVKDWCGRMVGDDVEAFQRCMVQNGFGSEMEWKGVVETVCEHACPDLRSGGKYQMYQYVTGQRCDHYNTIRAVQQQLSVPVDGKWGPKSQAALEATGRTYESFAEGCTGPAPGEAAMPGGVGPVYTSNSPCADANTIRYVQWQIGAAVDGKWGPKSQAALDATLLNYKMFAKGCTGPVPGEAAMPGGAGPVYTSSAPCADANTIRYVQWTIGAAVDGKWGPKSQAALTRYGATYKDVARGCTGRAPGESAVDVERQVVFDTAVPAYDSPPVVPGNELPVVDTTQPEPPPKGRVSAAWIVGGVLAAVAAVGAGIYYSKKG